MKPTVFTLFIYLLYFTLCFYASLNIFNCNYFYYLIMYFKKRKKKAILLVFKLEKTTATKKNTNMVQYKLGKIRKEKKN